MTLEETIEKLDAIKEQLQIHIEQEEIIEGSGTFRCAYPKCNKAIEPMEPYIIIVVNNTDEPEQMTYRFDSAVCMSAWDMTSGIAWAGMDKK